jgi:hypothetical protein
VKVQSGRLLNETNNRDFLCYYYLAKEAPNTLPGKTELLPDASVVLPNNLRREEERSF